MEPPTTYDQLKNFIERVSEVSRFISFLAKLLEPFYKLLKKKASF